MNSKRAAFIQLSSAETQSKFSQLNRADRKVTIWTRGELPVDLILDAWDDDSLVLDDSGCYHLVASFSSGQEGVVKPFLNSKLKLYLYFNIGVVGYIIELKSVVANSDKVNLQIIAPLLRLDKRGDERILAYPHRNAYIYLSAVAFGESESNRRDNVLPFASMVKDDRRDEFIKYGKMSNRQRVHPMLEGKEVVGFRVLDFSVQGGAFLVNRLERDLVSSFSWPQIAYLDFEGQLFELDGCNLVTIVDYLFSKAPSVPMYKVAIYFDSPGEQFNQLIEDLLGDKPEISSLGEELELFFNPER